MDGGPAMRVMVPRCELHPGVESDPEFAGFEVHWPLDAKKYVIDPCPECAARIIAVLYPFVKEADPAANGAKKTRKPVTRRPRKPKPEPAAEEEPPVEQIDDWVVVEEEPAAELEPATVDLRDQVAEVVAGSRRPVSLRQMHDTIPGVPFDDIRAAALALVEAGRIKRDKSRMFSRVKGGANGGQE
jgi:hypothetical protein